MRLIFKIVMKLLQAVARFTGLTYNEINIIVYYVLVPLLWAALLDWYIKLPVFAPLYLLFCLLVYLQYKSGSIGSATSSSTSPNGSCCGFGKSVGTTW